MTDEKCNEPCQLKDVANEDMAAESANSNDIVKLTAQSEIALVVISSESRSPNTTKLMKIFSFHAYLE